MNYIPTINLDKHQELLDFSIAVMYNYIGYICKLGRSILMQVSYNKLWKLLIDKNINKTQLHHTAKVSTNAVAKLGKNEPVSLETLSKICAVLDCGIGDIVEFTHTSKE